MVCVITVGFTWLDELSLWLLNDSELPPPPTGITIGATFSDCWLDDDEWNCDELDSPPPTTTGIPAASFVYNNFFREYS